MRIPTLAVSSLLLLPMLLTSCGLGGQTTEAVTAMEGNPTTNAAGTPMVAVRLFNERGELSDPVWTAKISHDEAEWRELLGAEQCYILRESGTERPFTGSLLKNAQAGVYTCAGCRLPLFSSHTKFDSGTGWPSYFAPVAPENVTERPDHSMGMRRTEILCTRCDGHLGHVFNDGPAPTGLRYCINSAAMEFVPAERLAELAETPEQQAALQGGNAVAVFAGGCFWCVEAVFQELDGVKEVVSGYAGGSADTARYEMVASGQTRHAEVVRITYDPSRVSYEALLRVHFATHDPTQLNRQGPDVGPQYRSAVFYASEEEKAAAQKVMRELTEAGKYSQPIVTTLEPLQAFYPAEDYHQNFVIQNPAHPYVQVHALPKIEKLRDTFPGKVRGQSQANR